MKPNDILYKKVIKLIDAKNNVFVRKQEQNILFQVQTILINKVFEKLSGTGLTQEEAIRDLVATYYDLKKKADTIGKSYESILLEKVFTDEYRFFEELIHDVFYVLYENFPKLLVGQLNQEIKMQFSEIYLTPDIHDFHQSFKTTFIEKRIMKDIQGNHIVNILGKFKSKFGVNFIISSDEKQQIYRLAQIRNIITHNDGVINNVYLESLRGFKITPKYQLKEQIGKYLEEEFKQEHALLSKLSKRLIQNTTRDIELISKMNDERK